MKVVYTQTAQADLRDIYEYISQVLFAPDAARALTELILQKARSLGEMPDRQPLWKDEPWRSLGVRFVSVRNYILFYTADQDADVVTIVRVMYGGRDIDRQLEETTEW